MLLASVWYGIPRRAAESLSFSRVDGCRRMLIFLDLVVATAEDLSDFSLILRFVSDCHSPLLYAARIFFSSGSSFIFFIICPLFLINIFW